MERIPEATRWLDAFFDTLYACRPVDATFIGVHAYDDRLPDFSDSGAGHTVAGMRELLDRLPGKAPDDPVEALDLRLAAGFLRIQIEEHEGRHFWGGNPSLYTGEAVFGVLSLFLTDFAPLGERIDRAIARLHAIPPFLANARERVRSAPRQWTKRAIRECDGALAFLEDGVARLGAEDLSSAGALGRAAEVATDAFRGHRDHLKDRLEGVPRAEAGCGEETLSLYLREGHFVDETAGEIRERARGELEEAAASLEARSRALGFETPAAALEALGERHPPVEDYYDRYGLIWDEIHALTVERDVVTWPDDPIRFVPRPAWAREAALSLYFLHYRSPAVFDRPPVHEVLVTPIDASMPADRREVLLRATNDGVIKLNHVIHHAGIGHHVQNGHARRSRSRVGRVAAVDAASRIAMFCGGTMAEGWACYATDLMREAGALTPLEEVSELRTRTRMCARAIADIELHTGRVDIEGASAFYAREIGMPAEAARSEAVRNSMFPGTALMYMLGTDAIHSLRRDVQRARGADFGLKAFHDDLMSFGSIPVSLVAESMRAAVDNRAADGTATPPPEIDAC